MKYCPKFGMVQCRSGYNGTCTMNVTNQSDFSKTSILLAEHEAACIIGRNDTRVLINQKINKKRISTELAESYINYAKKKYNIADLRMHTQGSTYVKFDDIVRIHLFESSSTQQVCFIDDRPNRRIKEVTVRRSWPIAINILQTEDKDNYGTQFRAIPKFNTGDKPSLLTWILFAILSSCPELWIIVDNKPTPFKWSGWEGWILTSIQKFCFEFETITVDRQSPISKLTSLSAITDKVNKFYRNENNNDE